MKLRRSIVQMSTLLLLILYVSGTSHLELIHAFVHDHENSVSHAVEQEKDPCHRLLYHHDTEQGCNHDSHLVVSDQCEMCDLACHGDQTLLFDSITSAEESRSVHFDFYKSNVDSYWAVISSSRAPPAVA